ncbi:MAG: PEGA domain-containing protein [Polyangiaceae bacterium]|nr:PEGA domain-containing protein [Polyangiaceae bacterium]MBK8940401.1 PEGA domain-containing protein [Polyangiaceae bacterium]
MKRTLATVLAVILAASVAAPPAGAQEAEAGADAYASWERGKKFFKEGDYVAAMVQFKRAYEIAPNYQVLFNIGQTARELKSYSEALRALEKYLAEGGAEIDAERRKNVEGWVTDLKEKVASVTIKTNVDGVEIAVDDVVVGKTPLAEPIVMDAGRRKVGALKEGYAPITRFVEVAGAEKKEIDLALVSLSGGGGGGGGGGGAAGPKEIEHTPWPWVGLGVTGALGVATGVMGGLALSKKADFEDALVAFPTTAQSIEDARSDAKTFALTADVLGGLTGAAAALTIVAFIVDYGRSPEEPAKASSIEPIITPGFVGARGAF